MGGDSMILRAFHGNITLKRPSPAPLFLFQLFVFMNICSLASFSQIDTGAIQGVVIDARGATLENASVQIQNESTGYKEIQTTRQDGFYVFPTVKVGNYTITARANGFKEVVHEHVSVSIQQQVVINFSMEVATVNSTVEVVAGQSSLQTDSVSVGQTVSGREINALPLNGRNYTLLAQLAPGTTTTVYDSGHGELQSGSFTANGVITTFNNYLLDGITNNNDTADFGNGTAYAIKPPPDALAEFKVETANYSAEYGRAGGAVLNAVTKSGANRVFGDIWEYNRNAWFDANDYFLNMAQQPRPSYNRNQYGFSLGGPIRRNKIFFFMDYEGLRIRQGQAYTSSVPTNHERSSGFTDFTDLITGQKGSQTDILGRTTPLGTIFDPATTRYLTKGYLDPVTGRVALTTGYVRDPFPQNIVPLNRISTVASKLLALFPAPNTNLTGIVNNYVSAPVLQQQSDSFDVRVDQNLSSVDELFARGSYALTPRIIPTPCPGLAECGVSATVGNEDTNIEGIALGETHIFSSTFVNELRVGYNRIHMDRIAPYGTTAGLNQQNGIPGIPDASGNGGLAQIKISGLSELGSHNNIPLNEIGSETQYNDNISLIRGRHSMRFGGEFERIKNAIFSSQFPHGYFSFSGAYTDVPNGNTASTGIAQFVIEPSPSTVKGCVPLAFNSGPPSAPGCYTYDYVGGANQIQGSPLSQQDYRKPYLGLYFTDNWKATSHLTFDIGLRYEYFSLGSDHHGRAANFVPYFASKNGSSQYLIDDRSRNVPLSSSFISLMNAQGVSIVYTANHSLGHLSKANWGPRVGLALQLTPHAVLRAGYGIFYAGIYARGDGYNPGDDYPFSFAVNVTSTTAAGLSADGSVGPIDKGLSNVPLTSVNAVGSQISPRGIQYDSHVPSIQDSNLTFQYQITENQYFQVAYVGTISRHLESNIGSNRPTQVLTPILPAGTTLATYLQYPGLPQNNYYMWLEGANNYNSLQAQYQKLFSGGTNLIFDYTWSKFLGYGSDSNLFNSLGYRAPYVAGFGMKGEYGNADFESAHVFHAGGGWQLPFGLSRRWLNRTGIISSLLGGWNLNGLWTFQSGQPVTINCTINTTTAEGCYSLTNASSIYSGAKTIAHWFNAAAFANPAPAVTVGQMDFSPFGSKPGQGFGPAFHRGDLGVQKLFRLPSSNTIEFRAEAFNITNTPNFGQPGTLTPSSNAFASITYTRDNPSDAREFQFAIKYNFGHSD